MPYYTGTVQRIQLLDKIVQLLTTPPIGSTKPYWEKVSTGSYQSEGIILKSVGKSGFDNIFVRFCYTTDTRRLEITTLENYIPNDIHGLPGTIVNESNVAYLQYHDIAYQEFWPVKYILSFDRDKIMIHLTGSKVVGSNNQYVGFIWVGMPKRLDSNDTSNGATTIACSIYGNNITNSNAYDYVNQGLCRMLRNRKNQANVLTKMTTILNRINKTKGWGDYLFLPDIYLEDNNGEEGVRAIMDGVHPIFQDNSKKDFQFGNEIIKGTKRFTVVPIAHDGIYNPGYYVNCFPCTWIAIEQL